MKVEGCGICGTDAHEYKKDPFSLIPVVLGHEGTGEIVKIGKNVKKDSAGKDLKLGDKVVTCMIFKDNPDITMFDLNKNKKEVIAYLHTIGIENGIREFEVFRLRLLRVLIMFWICLKKTKFHLFILMVRFQRFWIILKSDRNVKNK